MIARTRDGGAFISPRGIDTLSLYLASHEDDIAWEINDFGELKGLFIEMFNRSPKHQVKQGEHHG